MEERRNHLIQKCLYEPYRASERCVSNDYYYNEIKFPVGRRKTEYGGMEEDVILIEKFYILGKHIECSQNVHFMFVECSGGFEYIINFGENCREAIQMYEKAFNGKISYIITYGKRMTRHIIRC